jgi:localization factor PodJL
MEGVRQQRKPYREDGDGSDAALGQELAALNERLDDLTRHIEHLTQTALGRRFPAAWPGGPSSDRVAEALARLDRRLDQVIDEGRAFPHQQDCRAGAVPPGQPDPTPSQKSAEWGLQIAARQRALDGDISSEPAAETAAPQPPVPDLKGVEQQLRHITDQIDSLQQPYEEGLVALRNDLAEVNRTVSEVVPRQSIEAIERQVRSLAERIDGIGAPGPAAGDPMALKELEEAVASLRAVMSNVASEGTVVQLAAEVRGLASGYERAVAASGGGSITILDDRIAKLSQKLDATDSRLGHLGTLERGMAELLALVEEMRGAPRGSPTAPVAEAVTIDAPTSMSSAKEAVSEAPSRSPADQRAMSGVEVPAREVASEPEIPLSVAPPAASPLDFIPADSQPLLPQPAGSPAPSMPFDLSSAAAEQSTSVRASPFDLMPAEPEQILPGPLPAVSPASSLDLIPAAPEQGTLEASAPPTSPSPALLVPSTPEPPTTTLPAASPDALKSEVKPNGRARLEPRRPIDPNLPPDTPIEPGAGVPRLRTGSAAARIAASEAILGGARPAVETGGKSAAIAAARNAARAAALESSGKAPRSTVSGPLHLFDWFKKARNAQALPVSPTPDAPSSPAGPESVSGAGIEQPAAPGNGFLQRLKKVLVAASVAIIVVSAAQIAMELLLPSDRSESVLTTPQDAPVSAAPARPRPTADIMPPVTPAPQPMTDTTGAIDRQPPFISPADATAPDVPATIPGPIAPEFAPTAADNIIMHPPLPRPAPTGSSAAASEAKVAALQAGIAAHDPAAEYEMGARYAEGRGVPQDLQEAARWFERAANAGFAPAQFRLAGLNEKGEGVKKDTQAARRLYLSAADKGHAKAMHNLAVLYAEGIDGKPDYKAAAQWFRKAASYGITDSQYNLAILYARGIGVEVNLAESYKWFALAALRGDEDAAKKRDEVAARLNPQILMAAKLAVQTFAAEREPEEAVSLRVPPDGWDRAPQQPPAKARSRAAASPTR